MRVWMEVKVFQSARISSLLSKEDAERFYREYDKNQWFRKQLCILLEDELKKVAKQEELCYTNTHINELINSIAYRKALRELSNYINKDIQE